MARPEAERPSAGPHNDDLDALFEVDRGMDDMFESIRKGANNDDGNNTRQPKEVTYGRTRPTDDAVDGDEEIKITKKRKPIAKLDEARLLSEAGIPKLQKITKSRLKFRGKGNEFSDVAQLLRTYQLWLDDLYPRAKFTDGLAIIEKLGHTKRMQVRRKAWIREDEPKPSTEADDEDPEARLSVTPQPGSRPRTSGSGSPHSALPMDETADGASAPKTDTHLNDAIQPPAEEFGGPDEDELDALLAEEDTQTGRTNEIGTGQQGTHRPNAATEPSFEDDEEAMREMEGMDDLW